MYRHVDPSTGSSKTYCTSCSQYVDCAVCFNPNCKTVTCLPCYNSARSGASSRPMTKGIDQDPQQEEL